MDILAEFEKRYKGYPEDTMNICTAIADEHGLDVEEVADYVYINRYEAEPEEIAPDEPLDNEEEL